jgi:hypothetical protein
METTYAMIGSDGQQYGPVALAQIKNWIIEGRIGAATQVWRSDTNSWLPAAQYVELGLAQPMPPPIQATGADEALERHVRYGARWFYWVAVLSLLYTFIAYSGHGVVSVTGLAVTNYYFGFASGLGTAGPAVAFGLSAFTAGLFAMFGFFAFKRHTWSFIAGMVLYGLDALLLAVIGFWLGMAFHVFILFRLFRGLQACNQLNARSRTGQA